MTKEAFENAIAVVMALGGSTNAVLHLLAIAHEARVDLALEDFDRIGKKAPHLADMKPHGRFHMVDLDRIGGLPVVMKELLDAGLLHGGCLTVSGKTVAENLASLRPPAPDGQVVRPLSEPIHADGGLAILRGSLAPAGAVVKVAGLDFSRFEGRPGSSTASSPRSRRSSPAPSSRARWSSYVMKVPREARACVRCWPSPER